MRTAQNGDNVSVHYVGKLTDGTIFDESTGREPLQFTVGGNQVIEGFETAVIGLKEGDKVTVNIPKDKAYGDLDTQLVFDLPKESFPPEITIEEGAEIILSNPEGEELMVIIKEINEEKVIVDANHPLAGKDLIFDIELVKISE